VTARAGKWAGLEGADPSRRLCAVLVDLTRLTSDTHIVTAWAGKRAAADSADAAEPSSAVLVDRTRYAHDDGGVATGAHLTTLEARHAPA
jgi:hypothetical protein